jgi:UDP-glucose 4-epimerase
VIPTVLGFDARLQFIHEDDGLEALRMVTSEDHPGAFNIAGDGVLLLSQAARRAGRPILPIARPLVGLVGASVRRAGLADFSAEQVRYLTYPGWTPPGCVRCSVSIRSATVETFDEFVRARTSTVLCLGEGGSDGESDRLYFGGAAHA